MIEYWGWIPGKESDRQKLIALGVYGEMEHVKKEGDEYFNMCVCSEQTLEILIHKFPGLKPCSFTGVDKKTGKHLPNNKQKFWKYD